MKLIAVLLTIGFSATSAYASDMDEVQNCLRSWGKTPFSKENPDFRVISSKVRVMGIGDAVEDTRSTEKPELVLLKPAVSVMSKSIMKLMNPNGWYCIKGKVDVLGKTEIKLHCKAHMASSNDTTTVLGSNKANDGVTVLGKSVVTREGEGCDGEDSEPVAKHKSKAKHEDKSETKTEAKDKE